MLWAVDAAHFIGLVAGKAIPARCRTPMWSRSPPTRLLRGPRGGMILSTQEHAAAIDKGGLPDDAGRSSDARGGGEGRGALKEASTPQYQQYARAVIENAQALTAGLEAEGMRAVTGGTDTHLALLDLQPMGVTGAGPSSDAAGIVLNRTRSPSTRSPRASPAASGSGLRA